MWKKGAAKKLVQKRDACEASLRSSFFSQLDFLSFPQACSTRERFILCKRCIYTMSSVYQSEAFKVAGVVKTRVNFVIAR